ncbi:cache domain-containing protein [Azorhizobium doebereinerae]|uniref:cache domain-containing protein n=1 Tax=Azorhizobium doebereinerae TaxID=281091 RepID=UPI000414FA6C|nr:cache domain-containing protein [Azorhizobium doebereinerae]
MLEVLRRGLRKLPGGTIRPRQLGAFLALVCILGLVIVSGIAARLSSAAVAERIQQNMVTTATGLADRLDMDMFERYREIRNLANMRPLAPIWEGDPAQVQAVLDQVQATMKHFAWIGFARPDGTVLAATRGLLQGVSVAARPWFKDGLRGPAVGDLHEAVMLAKLLDARPGDDPERFVDIAFPVRAPDGRLLGVLGAHLSSRWAEGLRQRVLKAQPGTKVSVLSAGGVVLLGEDPGSAPFAADEVARMGVTRSGAFVHRFNGVQMLTGYAVADGAQDYPGLKWIVVAQQPSDAAFASAYRLAFTIIAVGGVVLIVCGGLSLWLVGRIRATPL